MNSLEEELKQLKSSTFQKVNNNNKLNDFELSKIKIEENNIKKGLVIRSISKTYDKRKVVNEVSLELQKGEAVGLLGPNGAGKTTCFYMRENTFNSFFLFGISNNITYTSFKICYSF